MAQEFSLIPNSNRKRFRANVSPGAIFAEYRSVVLLILTLASLWLLYMAFSWWEGASQRSVATIQQEQSAILLELEESDLEGARDFAAQVRGVQRILRSHVVPSQVTEPFEESVHNQVVVNTFDLDVPSRMLRVSATAPSLTVMGEQFVQWRDEAPFVETIVMEQFSGTAEGSITFSVLVTVKEGFLREPGELNV